jgi:hypothetical protein
MSECERKPAARAHVSVSEKTLAHAHMTAHERELYTSALYQQQCSTHPFYQQQRSTNPLHQQQPMASNYVFVRIPLLFYFIFLKIFF